MHTSHGTLVRNGQSLNGLGYRRGDPVAIFEDGRNDNCTDVIHVLNLQSGESILVPLAAVSWIPAYAEQRPGAILLFTLYGRRLHLQEPGEREPVLGSRAVQISLGSMHRVSHTTVLEENLATWAQQLQEADKQGFFGLQWRILSSSSGPSKDMDTVSESSTSFSAGSPSLTSPSTPISTYNQNGVMRRDSAIDLRCQSECGEAKDGLGLHVPSVQGDVRIWREPTASESPVHFGMVSHQQFSMADLSGKEGQLLPGGFPTGVSSKHPNAQAFQLGGNTAQPGPSGAPQEHHLLGQDVTSRYHVNYMYLPHNGAGQRQSTPSYQQSPGSGDNGITWTNLAPFHSQPWQPSYPESAYPGDHFQQPSPMTSQSTQLPPPRVHVPSTPNRQGEAEWNRAHPLSASTYPGGLHGPAGVRPHHNEAPFSEPRAISGDVASPVFYRTQEQHTMGLTSRVEPFASSPLVPQAGASPIAPRTPALVTDRRQSAPAPANPFRPELIVDSFRRQTRPHIDVLEARQQGQQIAGSAETPSSSVIHDALELIRTATADALKVLETLRPGSMNSFERTEQRLRQEVDRIIASIQTVRQVALEGRELPRQDRRQLNQRVESLKDFIDYLGDVYTDVVVRSREPPQPASHGGPCPNAAAPTGFVPSQDPQNLARPEAAEYAHAVPGPSAGSFHWIEGQTTPPPDQGSGMAVSYEHQRILQQLSNSIARSQSLPNDSMAVSGMPMAADSGVHPMLQYTHQQPVSANMPHNAVPSPDNGWAANPNAAAAAAAATVMPLLQTSGQPMSPVYSAAPYGAPGQQNVPGTYLGPPVTLPSNSQMPVGPQQPQTPALGPPAPIMAHSPPYHNHLNVGPASNAPSPRAHEMPGSVAMTASMSAPGTGPSTVTGTLTSSPIRAVAAPDRRGSLPDRRLFSRERHRVGPYAMGRDSFRDRKPSLH